MIVALGGAIYETLRDGPERWGLLMFYALLLGLGTAIPSAVSLFGSTNQQQPGLPPAPVPVDLQHPDRPPAADVTTP